MSITEHAIKTPLGVLSVRVVGLDDSDCRIDLLTPTLKLPPGRSVDGVVAAVIQITPTQSTSAVRCECVWDQAPGSPYPDTGERLDAQYWDSNGHRVTVGTEDCVVLCGRLPDLGFTEDRYPVIYNEDRLSILIPNVTEGARFSLHFVIAWRSWSNPDDISTWLAVEIPHAELEAAIKIAAPEPPLPVPTSVGLVHQTLDSLPAPGSGGGR